MNAREMMNRPVVTAGKTTSARDVVIRMLLGRYSGVPLTEKDGKVVGIVSDWISCAPSVPTDPWKRPQRRRSWSCWTPRGSFAFQ